MTDSPDPAKNDFENAPKAAPTPPPRPAAAPIRPPVKPAPTAPATPAKDASFLTEEPESSGSDLGDSITFDDDGGAEERPSPAVIAIDAVAAVVALAFAVLLFLEL